MLSLSFYTVNYFESINVLMIVFIIHLVLFSVEILQLTTDYKNYFYDTWNIFDQLRTWSFHYYIFSVIV